jgi:hypothetical protein
MSLFLDIEEITWFINLSFWLLVQIILLQLLLERYLTIKTYQLYHYGLSAKP